MFRLMRYYLVTSFVAVLATAVLLIWFYRQVSVQGIADLAERGNLTLARAALSSMKPALLKYLAAAANFQPNSASPLPLPPELTEPIETLIHDRTIARVKIYNRKGVVVFSTWPAQIGGDQSHNQGFIAAINGGVASNLVYHDTFNHFDGATERDNLGATYIPVRAGPTEPIQGVFEIYTDVNRQVQLTERAEFIIMAGAILILSALYAVLVFIVRRANTTIELQQHTIRERTETLELLSAQMLKSEELHKKKLAFELHEGLAQTLAALKLKVENGQHNRRMGDATAESEVSIIPVLQATIQEVRTMATELRPPSLDDLGLLSTLNWVCREFEQQHPGIRIERETPIQEQDIPAPLKAILYRIIVSVIDDLGQHTNAEQIHLALWLDDTALILLIDDTTTEMLDRTVTPLAKIDPQLRAGFARMEALTTLSGGSFTALHYSGGGTTLRAAWKR